MLQILQKQSFVSLPLRISTSSMQLSFQQKTKNPALYFEPEFRERLSLWAYAAHPRGIFPFTRKDTKGVSKGTPLRYPHPSITKVWCITGGIEGGPPPSAGNPKTRRFLVNLWILSFHKKVSPGCRGGEPPCKRNRVTESKLRTNNIWDYTPNGSL